MQYRVREGTQVTLIMSVGIVGSFWCELVRGKISQKRKK